MDPNSWVGSHKIMAFGISTAGINTRVIRAPPVFSKLRRTGMVEIAGSNFFWQTHVCHTCDYYRQHTTDVSTRALPKLLIQILPCAHVWILVQLQKKSPTFFDSRDGKILPGKVLSQERNEREEMHWLARSAGNFYGILPIIGAFVLVKFNNPFKGMGKICPNA